MLICEYRDWLIINKMTNKIIGFSQDRWMLPEASNLDIINQLLVRRGIVKDDSDFFLEKKFENLSDPKKIKNAEKVADLIWKTIQKKQNIILFGDYDADGIPATFLAESFINKVGGKVSAVIPNRSDGYGLTEKSKQNILKLDPYLIITVDNGTNSPEIINNFIANGKQVIVIDHHEISVKNLPNCLIINPKQGGDKSCCETLTAGGLVFKIILLIIKKYLLNDTKWQTWIKWQMDLVAISTICDVAPLLGENRILVDKGILVMKKNRRNSLKYLFEISKVNPELIDTYTIGFIIGPRINATGRMGDSNLGYEFIKSDGEKAKQLAHKLQKINSTRQEIFKKNLLQALDIFELSDFSHAAIVAHNDWNEGFVGLIAAKLCEQKYIPTFAFSDLGDKLVGSARSIDGINLVELLDKTAEYLVEFGGHEKAAGLTIEKKNYNLWKNKIINTISKIDNSVFEKKIQVDARIPIDAIRKRDIDVINKLAPFGMGNPQPLFFDSVKIESIKKIGAQKNHLGLSIISGNKVLNAVSFNHGEWFKKIQTGKIYQILFQISESQWPGRDFEIKIKDMANYE